MIRILTIICVLSGLVTNSYAQHFTNNEDQFVDGFVTSANSLILDGKTGIKANEAAAAVLSATSQVPLTLKKISVKALDASAIFNKTKAATVIMGSAYLCTHCSHTHVAPATGFIIGDDGVVVTNFHVVAMFADNIKRGNTPLGLFARLEDGRTFPVKTILAAVAKDDLAIVKLDINNQVLPSLALAKGAKVGDEVFVVGHPKGMYYFLSKGMVNHRYIDKVVNPSGMEPRETMIISADYAVGSSGGPVVNQFGDVVGIVSNTRTVFHSDDNPSLQMVIKNTIPVESLRRMVK